MILTNELRLANMLIDEELDEESEMDRSEDNISIDEDSDEGDDVYKSEEDEIHISDEDLEEWLKRDTMEEDES